jgi:hypothetical protein
MLIKITREQAVQNGSKIKMAILVDLKLERFMCFYEKFDIKKYCFFSNILKFLAAIFKFYNCLNINLNKWRKCP